MKKKKAGRVLLSFLLSLAMVIGFMPGMGLTAYAVDEVSENISLVASNSTNITTISGTHYSVSCGYMAADAKGMPVNSFGALTINARKGETITKVILSYSEGGNRNTLSASTGAFDGNSTITGINAQQVSISSSSTAGVKISAVTVYFEGSLSNPTVTLSGGANAKSSGGLLTQSYLPGAMDTVTYTALTGASFPEFENFTQNGVTVERTSDTVVIISGTPTANTAIIVPDAVSSSKIVTWNSATISSIRSTIANDYTYTAYGITLNKTGKGKFDNNSIKGYDSTASFEFTTATGKITNIEIEASTINSGGNWTMVGNTLKWNGTPSNSVSLSGSIYVEGISSITFVIEMPTNLSAATVTLGADNTVSSITVGGNEITDLSEFDITYGTDDSHTATTPPTEYGTYYAYVTAKVTSEDYTGTAKSAAFVVATADSSDSGSSSSSSGSSDNANTNTDTSAKVPYDDVAISTGSVNDITGTESATAESNPFETKIENNDNLTTLLALTPQEVAQGVNVWLDIQDMSDTVPQADKDLVQNASTNLTVGMYLDINMFKKVGSNDATKVTETNGKVKASILIPESLWKAGRTFEIIRVHDGEATAIEGTYDENTHVFTFETDKFSTYALAYKDSASLNDSGTNSNSGSPNTSNSTQSSTPKTGDPNDIRVWYLLLLASIGGLGFLGFSKKKKVND